jgi:DMSO/TMAO reductase YedYZ molybdopterin-dependent catalytic subunit
VTLSGPKGTYSKEARFPIGHVFTHKVFLACGVNGETLTKKYNFPLRVVAEGYYGNDWVKYVYKMIVEKT